MVLLSIAEVVLYDFEHQVVTCYLRFMGLCILHVRAMYYILVFQAVSFFHKTL
jgi:hypothetical protein